MSNRLEELKEKNPLEFYTRMFDTRKNSIMNMIDTLDAKKGAARVLKALLVYPLNDFKKDKDGQFILDKNNNPVPLMGLKGEKEKVLFDFCIKMIQDKAMLIQLGTEEIIKEGESVDATKDS